jgi:hypothetical protein
LDSNQLSGDLSMFMNADVDVPLLLLLQLSNNSIAGDQQDR